MQATDLAFGYDKILFFLKQQWSIYITFDSMN